MKSNFGPSVSRRFVLGALLASTGQVALADAPLSSLRPKTRPEASARRIAASSKDILANSGITGKLGFVVADARTGLILESQNPVLGLPPASVAKAITAQYALDTLGPTYVFHTRLVATGPLRNGRIEGDLVLLGGGDPTLDTDALAEMAAALKSAGVREVTGRFLVNSSALPRIDEIDSKQPDYLGYNPAISGLNLNYNRVHFEWKRANQAFSVTMDARSENYRPAVSIARMKIVERDMPVYTYASSQNVDRWTVASTALGNGGSRWLPVRRPDLYAAEVFQVFARSHGIQLKKVQVSRERAYGTVLVDRKSSTLQRILKNMLAYSTNLTAEVVGLTATKAGGASVSGLVGSARKMNQWADERLGTRKARLVDHSGLGDGSRLSASDMVKALVRTGPDGTLASILKPVPTRDNEGKRIKNSRVSVRAKTGTLNFVSGLAGYIKAADGTDLAFAIFAADMNRRGAIRDNDREKPRGAKGWNNQARRVQDGLIRRWATLYGT